MRRFKGRKTNNEKGKNGGGLISLFTKMNKDSIQDIYKGKPILKSESLLTDKFRRASEAESQIFASKKLTQKQFKLQNDKSKFDDENPLTNIK